MVHVLHLADMAPAPSHAVAGEHAAPQTQVDRRAAPSPAAGAASGRPARAPVLPPAQGTAWLLPSALLAAPRTAWPAPPRAAWSMGMTAPASPPSLLACRHDRDAGQLNDSLRNRTSYGFIRSVPSTPGCPQVVCVDGGERGRAMCISRGAWRMPTTCLSFTDRWAGACWTSCPAPWHGKPPSRG